MKQTINKLMLLCISFSFALSSQAQTKWTSGSGTESDPYQISTIENLKYLAQEVNAGTDFDSVYFKQTADLVDNENVFKEDGSLNTTCKEWIPIGNETTPFNAIYDGDGFSISGLYINNDKNYQGLFGYADTKASLTRIFVSDSYIKGDSIVGGICALCFGTISNCMTSGEISGNDLVGGICGKSHNIIQNCLNASFVSGKGICGGICGRKETEGNIYSCINCGCLSANNGGICCFAKTEHGNIYNCFCDRQLFGNKFSVQESWFNSIYDYDSSVGCLLTKELTGLCQENLIDFNTNDWVFTEGLYPIPSGIRKNDAVNVAITPFFLKTDNANYETSGNLTSNFKVSTLNEAKWSSCGKISLEGEDAIIKATKNNYDTLIVRIGNSEKRLLFYINLTQEKSEIEINTIEELEELRDSINSGKHFSFKGFTIPPFGENVYFKQTADFTFNENIYNEDGSINASSKEWTPIGSTYFSGIYDGDNHTISGLYINGNTINDIYDSNASCRLGLFGKIGKAGEIKNLTIKDSYFKGTYSIGSFCGINYGKITNCINYSPIIGNKCIGGIAGLNEVYGHIYRCINTGKIEGRDRIGGITGSSYGYIANCLNNGNIKGSTYIGGINGEGADTQNSFNSGIISAEEYAGGIGICTTPDGICSEGENMESCINVGNINPSAIVVDVLMIDNHFIKNLFFDIQMYYNSQLPSYYCEPTDSLTGQLYPNMFMKESGFKTENWIFKDGFYPVPAGLDTTNDIVRVASTPIFLNDKENVNEVKSDFKYTNYEGAEWSASSDSIKFQNGEASILYNNRLTYEVPDTISVKYGNASKNIIINIKGSLSDVDDISQDGKFSPYPNPTTNGVYIDLGENKDKEVAIYSSNGLLMQRRTISGKSFIEMSSYVSGIYFIHADGKTFKVEKR